MLNYDRARLQVEAYIAEAWPAGLWESVVAAATRLGLGRSASSLGSTAAQALSRDVQCRESWSAAGNKAADQDVGPS